MLKRIEAKRADGRPRCQARMRGFAHMAPQCPHAATDEPKTFCGRHSEAARERMIDRRELKWRARELQSDIRSQRSKIMGRAISVLRTIAAGHAASRKLAADLVAAYDNAGKKR